MTPTERSQYVYGLLANYERGPAAVKEMAEELKGKASRADILWIGAGLGKLFDPKHPELAIMITHIVTVLTHVFDGTEPPPMKSPNDGPTIH